MTKTKRARSITLAVVPSLNRQREIAMVAVPDPYQPSTTILVAKNVRAHPADFLHARGSIDDAQRAAADRIRTLYERAEIGGSRAIDYSRVRVDGGTVQEPLAEAVHAARKALNMARHATGEAGWAILSPVMGEGIPIERLARERPSLARGLMGKRAMGYITGRLREALDDLVAHWGLIAVGARHRRISAERDMALTGPVAEWEIGRFGDLQEVQPRPVVPRPVRKPKRKKNGTNPRSED